MLLVFPNVFEWFFLLQLWLLRFRPTYVLTARRAAGWVALLLVPKLAQEYLLHYVRVLDDYVATDVIGDACAEALDARRLRLLRGGVMWRRTVSFAT